MKFQKLSQRNAQHIAYRWKYKDIYSGYSLSKDQNALQEFISQKLRKKNYYEIIDDNKLIGYLHVEEKDDGIWVNFGMRPDQTGQGKGQAFLDGIIEFVHDTFGIDKPILLAVSLFNERAIHLFKKNKFYDIHTRKFNLKDGQFDYVILRRDW